MTDYSKCYMWLEFCFKVHSDYCQLSRYDYSIFPLKENCDINLFYQDMQFCDYLLNNLRKSSKLQKIYWTLKEVRNYLIYKNSIDSYMVDQFTLLNGGYNYLC